MAENSIRLVIVEDEQLLAQALGEWLKSRSDYVLLGRAQTGLEGWDLCLNTRPDVALLDIALPGLDGLELGRRLLRKLPKTRVLVMSGQSDPYTIWRVRQSGVHGYVDKIQSPALLVDAIRIVAEGGTYFSSLFENVKQQWLSQPDAFYKILSEREQEVLRQVVAGQTDESIGQQLGISAATVSAHRKHIRQKLELHSDRDLMAYARQWGLDGPGILSPQQTGS
jgi:DNA-binding NarL/FixJ family response regulator